MHFCEVVAVDNDKPSCCVEWLAACDEALCRLWYWLPLRRNEAMKLPAIMLTRHSKVAHDATSCLMQYNVAQLQPVDF